MVSVIFQANSNSLQKRNIETTGLLALTLNNKNLISI